MIKEGLYKNFAKYYDSVYSQKKYQKEVSFIDKIIKKHTKGKDVLKSTERILKRLQIKWHIYWMIFRFGIY